MPPGACRRRWRTSIRRSWPISCNVRSRPELGQEVDKLRASTASAVAAAERSEPPRPAARPSRTSLAGTATSFANSSPSPRRLGMSRSSGGGVEGPSADPRSRRTASISAEPPDALRRRRCRRARRRRLPERTGVGRRRPFGSMSEPRRRGARRRSARTGRSVRRPRGERRRRRRCSLAVDDAPRRRAKLGLGTSSRTSRPRSCGTRRPRRRPTSRT